MPQPTIKQLNMKTTVDKKVILKLIDEMIKYPLLTQRGKKVSTELELDSLRRFIKNL